MTGRAAPDERHVAEGLAIAVQAGGFDRVHYALVMASAAAAVNRSVTLFFTGRAVRALLPPADGGTPAWHGLDPAEDGLPPADRDALLQARGVAGIEELLAAAAALGVAFLVCEMAVRAQGLPDNQRFRPDLPVEVAGAVTLLAQGKGGIIFI